MINLTKPFLITFLQGCLIGFFALLLTKALSSLVNHEAFSLNFDLVFLMSILVGGILFAAFFTKKG